MESAIGCLRGTLLKATDTNGIVGYGFVIEYGGIEQLSVSWPDRCSERFTPDMVDHHGLKLEEAFPEKPKAENPSSIGPITVEEDEGGSEVEF